MKNLKSTFLIKSASGSGGIIHTLLLWAVAFLFFVPAQGQPFTEHTINGNFNGAYDVYATDVDGDGDIDVLGAGHFADDITWWENDGNASFTEHTISDNFDGAIGVYAIDVDGDGDVDVLGAAYFADDITWWENDGNESFTKHTISSNFDGALRVYATDVDGDGDIDVLGTAKLANDITWWENDGNASFTEHTIKGNYSGAFGVYATDVDGDGDVDVLGAAWLADDITWWENDGNASFIEHTISGNFDGAMSVYGTDVDGDGDVDVLGAAWDGGITWWENDGNETFTEHPINGYFSGASSVYGTDIDGDGDVDVLGGAANLNDVTWWENDGSALFTEHTISGNFGDVKAVYATDVDGDGDVDVLGAARVADDITWWENDAPLPTPPTAVCQSITVNAINSDGAVVAAVDLDGGSYDPDGDALTFSIDPTGPFPFGQSNVVLTVYDGEYSDDCSATIDVLLPNTFVDVVGDCDGFGTGLSYSELGREYLNAEPDVVWPDYTFDGTNNQWCYTQYFIWTHNFNLPANAQIISATMQINSIGIQQGDPSNTWRDELYIDNTLIPGAFDGVNAVRPASITYVNIPNNLLGLLDDGELNISIDSWASGNVDCIRFDYAEVVIQYYGDYVPSIDGGLCQNGGEPPLEWVVPDISCPADITVNTTPGQCEAVVSFTATETTGIPASTIMYSTDPGSTFDIGTTTVTATATNAEGSDQCTFDINIVDNEAPLLTCNGQTYGGSISLNAGDILAVDRSNGNIVAIEPMVGGNVKVIACGFVNPAAVIQESSGDLLVFDLISSDPFINVLYRIEKTTGSLSVLSSGNYLDDNKQILDIDIDTNGEIIVSVRAAAQLPGYVLRIDPGTGIQSIINSSIYQPTGIDIRSDGMIMVTSTNDEGGINPCCQGSLFEVDPISGVATQVGPLNPNGGAEPFDIAVDAAGNYFISDYISDDIHKLNNDGTSNIEWASFPEIVYVTYFDGFVWASGGPWGEPTSWKLYKVDPDNQNSVITIAEAYSEYSFTNFNFAVNGISLPDNDSDGIVDSCDDAIPSNEYIVNVDPGECGAYATLPVSATDNCNIVTVSSVPASGSFFEVGTTLVITTATDAAGNETECSFYVTVTDDENPEIACPADINENATSTAGAVVTYDTPIGTDNCTPTTEQIAGLASGSTFPIGTTLNTFEVIDPAGLSSSCSFSVIVTGVAPVIECPANIVVNNDPGDCDAIVSFVATETIGIPASTITYSHNPGTAFPVGTTTVTATATNAVGTSSCTFDVSVEDDENPVISCSGGSVQELLLNTGFNGLSHWTVSGRVGYYSDCGGDGVASFGNAQAFPDGVLSQDISPGSGAVMTIDLVYGMRGHVGGTVDARLDVIDNLTTNIIYTENLSVGGSNCSTPTSDSRNVIATSGDIKIQFTDITPNQGSKDFYLYNASVMSGGGGDITVSTDAGLCSASGVSLNSPLVSDNCSIASTTNDGNEPYALGTTIVTWTTTDNAGNQAQCQQTVTVEDNELPFPDVDPIPDVTGECGVTLIPPTATDNCTFLITGTTTDPLSYSEQGTYSVTWTYDDGNDNIITQTQTVVVDDVTPPNITCPNNINEIATSAVGAVVSFTDPVGTDNCTPTTTQTDGLASGSTFPIGTTENIFTVTDPAGLSSSCSFSIIVDGVAPEIVCPVSFTVNNDEGDCGAIVDFEAVDNTGIPESVISYDNIPPDSFFDIGDIEITATATNVAGTDDCSFTVTVVDNEDPIIICSAGQTQDSDPGVCEAEVTVTPPTVSDNCSGLNLGNSLSFDGINDDVSIPVDPAFNFPTGEFTYEAWGKHVTSGLWNQTALVSHRTAGGNIRGLLPSGGSSRMGFWMVNTNIQSPAIPNIENWHHYAGTYDGSTMKLYVDGVLVASTPYNAGISSSSDFVFIGRDNCCGGRFFSGFIDEVRIWNTARSASEIQTYMNIELSGNESGLLAYYNFNQGIAGGNNAGLTNLPDETVNGHNGTLNYFNLIESTSNWVEGVSLSTPISLINDYNNSADASDTYPVGTTTVTWTAKDAAGNEDICTQLITVTDDEAPLPDIGPLPDATGECGVTLTPPAATDNCEGTIIATTTDPLDFYAQGTYTVTWTYDDGNGNTSQQVQNVIVDDVTPPTTTCPTDIVVNTDGGLCSSHIVYEVIADDNCGGSGSATQILVSKDVTGEEIYNDPNNILPAGVSNITLTGSRLDLKVAPVNFAVVLEIPLLDPGVLAGFDYANFTLDIDAIRLTTDNDPTFFLMDGSGRALGVMRNDAGNTTIYHDERTINNNVAWPLIVFQPKQGGLGIHDTYSISWDLQCNSTTVDWSYGSGSGSFTGGNLDLSSGLSLVLIGDAAGEIFGINSLAYELTVSSIPDACDNCSNGNCDDVLTLEQISGLSSDSDFPVGMTTNVFRVTDIGGNSTECSFNVTVNDTEAPVAVCNDITIDLPDRTTYNLTQTDIDAIALGSSDNCSYTYSITDGITSYDCDDRGAVYTVELTAVDPANNSHSCTADVHIVDTQSVCNDPPVASCKDITIYTGDNCDASIVPGDVDDGSSDPDDDDLSYVLDDDGPFGVGNYTVNLTVSDGEFSDDCEAIVTVEDNTPPDALCQDVTVVLDANGNASITEADINNGSSDNCGIANVALDLTTFDCSNVGGGQANNYALDFDGSNDWVKASERVSASSLGLPVREITLESWVKPRSYAIWRSMVSFFQDNGSFERGWDLETRSGGRFAFALNSVGGGGGLTYMQSTNSFSTNEWHHVAGVYDGTTMKLYIDGQLENTSTAENGDIWYSNAWLALGMYKDDNENFSIPGTLDEIRIWNIARSQVEIQSTMNTTLSGSEAGLIAYYTFEDGPGSTIVTDVTGNGYDGTLTNMDPNSDWISGSVVTGGAGGNPVLLTVTDVNGNIGTCEATVTVEDNEVPVITCPDNIIVGNDAGHCSAVVNYNTPVGTDNCTPTTELTDGLGSGSVFPIGTTIEKYVVTDPSGNSAECSFTVTVNDTEAPVAVCNNITIDLPDRTTYNLAQANIDAIALGSSDNCSYTYSITDGITSYDCDDRGAVYTVELTAVDPANNSHSCTADVHIVDKQSVCNDPPIAACKDITIYTGDNCDASIVPEDVDDGSSDPDGDDLSYVLDDDGPFGVGTYTVTMTVSDGEYSDDCEAIVTVEDNTPPDALCQDITVELDANGNASISEADINNGSNDACGIALVELDQTAFVCAEVGDNIVVLTVTDVNDNPSTCEAVVTVEDNYVPTFTHPGDVTLEKDGLCQVDDTPNGLAGDVTDEHDNCPLGLNATYSDEIVNNCSGTYTITRTWSLSDINGNTAIDQVQTITVVDNLSPVITSEASDLTKECDGSGNTDDLNAWLNSNGGATASDNCSNVTWTNNFMAMSDDCGATGTVTVIFTATDACNNASTTEATFTIVDMTPPSIDTEASDQVVECDGAGNTAELTSWLDSHGGTGVASDICSNVTWSHNFITLPFVCASTGSVTVIFTATDECNNASTTDATFTIADTTPPEITCPDAIQVCADQDIVSGAIVSWTEPTPTDVCGSVIFVSTHDPGDVFDLGVTTVSYTATDQCDHMSTCSFEIEVYELTELYISESELPIYCQENAKILTANIVSGTGVTDYSWSTGESGADMDAIHVQTSGTYSVTVTDVNGCTRETSYDVIVTYGDLLSAYTIIGEDDVHLHGNNIVLNGGVGVIDDKGKAKIHDESFVSGPTTFVKSDKIEIDNDSGVDTEILEPADVILPEFLFNPFDSDNDVTVDKNTSIVLTEQIYGKIDIKEGATVEFTQTDLFIEDLKTKEDVTIIFPSCAFVRIEKNLDFYKNVTVNPDGHQVQFYVDSNVEVKEGAVVNASIDARGHNMNVKGKEDTPTYMNGQYIGKKIHGDKYVTWDWGTACDPGCMPSDPPPNITCDCKGGMIELVIDYAGGAGANLTVNDGTITDNGDGSYTVSNGGEKLEKNFEIDDGTDLGEIHTSCSQDILGQTFAGVYTVISHTDKYGGTSTVADCPDATVACECSGGMVELVIDYAGGAGANLTVNDGTITDNGDGTYTVSNDGEKLEKNFEIDDGTDLGEIHTSCSQDILGQTFAGVYTVVAHTDKYGNISTVEDCPDGVDFGPESIEISMRRTGENTDFKVYPNPSGIGLIYVGIHGESTNDVKLILIDILGEVMMVHNQVVYKGNNVFELDVSHLSSGTYVVKLISDSHEMTTSIILMYN